MFLPLFNTYRVLVIGGGDGHTLMQLLKHKSLTQIQQVWSAPFLALHSSIHFLPPTSI
jgi:predicted membrane-bound spermidine synthase